MKTLYLIRHGKSSWDNPGLMDIDRPLSERGKRDAPVMGQFLKNKQLNPDLFLSSPAKRALTTAQAIAVELGYNSDYIQTDQDIYHADVYELLRRVRSIGDENNEVLLFGHNPGFTDFANFLTGMDIYNLPTCGIVCIDFHIDSWSEIGRESGECRYVEYPKNLR